MADFAPGNTPKRGEEYEDKLQVAEKLLADITGDTRLTKSVAESVRLLREGGTVSPLTWEDHRCRASVLSSDPDSEIIIKLSELFVVPGAVKLDVGTLKNLDQSLSAPFRECLQILSDFTGSLSRGLGIEVGVSRLTDPSQLEFTSETILEYSEKLKDLEERIPLYSHLESAEALNALASHIDRRLRVLEDTQALLELRQGADQGQIIRAHLNLDLGTELYHRSQYDAALPKAFVEQLFGQSAEVVQVFIGTISQNNPEFGCSALSTVTLLSLEALREGEDSLAALGQSLVVDGKPGTIAPSQDALIEGVRARNALFSSQLEKLREIEGVEDETSRERHYLGRVFESVLECGDLFLRSAALPSGVERSSLTQQIRDKTAELGKYVASCGECSPFIPLYISKSCPHLTFCLPN